MPVGTARYHVIVLVPSSIGGGAGCEGGREGGEGGVGGIALMVICEMTSSHCRSKNQTEMGSAEETRRGYSGMGLAR